jgi:hypothetical protein
VQLENIIVNQKNVKCAIEKVYGSYPKCISNMRSIGEMTIVARHSDKICFEKTVIFIGYSNHHEQDVYKFLSIHTKKPIISREVIWLNKTYSQHMEITQVEFTASEEEENVEQTEHELDILDKVPISPLLPVPYPKG